MTELPASALGAVIGGRLQRDFILPYEGKPRLNVLGGNLPFAAAAYAFWGGRAGLYARVPAEFPLEQLERLNQIGCDLSGITRVKEALDDRRFAAYSDPLSPRGDNPIARFAERDIPFPRELIGYDSASLGSCSKLDYESFTARVNDLPKAYLDLTAAHICPIDYLSHKILTSLLKAGMIETLTLRACACYMDSSFWEEIRGLVSDLTAFMLTEADALRLFRGRSVDLWEIAEALANYGPEFVLVHLTDGSVRLFDRMGQKRWVIPAYPTNIIDPTGALDAFDGAFLLNYRKKFDAVDAALCGNVTAAVCMEGFGPYYVLDALPELMNARLDVLRGRVSSA